MKEALVLFDFGGVIAVDHQDPAEQKLMDLLKVNREQINSLLSEKSLHGKAFRENKITEAEFWGEVHRLSKINQKEECSILTALFCETYSLNYKVIDIINSLKLSSYVGILTNIDYARSDCLKKLIKIDTLVDFYYPSYQFGCSKDSEELWMKVDSIIKSNLNISTIVYIDDRFEHVNSANAIGWLGIHYKSSEQLKKELISHKFFIYEEK